MFDAREHIHDLPEFEFIGLDGETYKLPNLGSLTNRQLSQIDSDTLGVIRELNEAAHGAILEMPGQTGRDLAEAWLAHGDEAGKGEPLRSRTTSTRSKQTRSTKASTQRN